jgi:ribonuclease P protein component
MERLTRRTDFRAAATALRAAVPAFVLQARRRAESGPVRIGFTVSRQVGNAVERNRVRRRLREVVRLAAQSGLAQGGLANAGMHDGHDYVLIGRRAALALPFGEMRQEFDAALGRIHAPPPPPPPQPPGSRDARCARQLAAPANGPYIKRVRRGRQSRAAIRTTHEH